MAKWYKWLTNPIGAAVQSLTGSKSVVSKLTNPIDALVQLQTNNEVAGLGDAISGATKNMGKTVTDIEEKLKNNKHVQAFIENVTGERDTAENEKNRDFQSEEAQIARDWEAEQAQIAREWDSIGSQMERAAAAGVNPISIAMQNGGINASATSPMPSSPGIPAGSNGLMHSGIMDIAGSVFSGIGTFAEQRLKQAQSDDIVIMRKYNIAEKIANTDHLRELAKGVQLSNVAQDIQNRWLDRMNQATYDGMLLENGVRRSTILEKRSIARLNMQQVASIRQDMNLALERFNQMLPLELQLTQEQIDLTHNQAGEVYENICLRHLQAIEQESRNVVAANEAEQSIIETGKAKATYEDAICAFHNDMVNGAAKAGIAFNDYCYYGLNPSSIAGLPGAISIRHSENRRSRHGWNNHADFPSSVMTEIPDKYRLPE